MFESIMEFINSKQNPDITLASDYQCTHLPTLWLLGKTGAGKSSLIKGITGLNDVQIGNGFAPCTLTSRAFDFPKDKPLLRFLDTRGLGEANYDPSEDIKSCGDLGHILMVIAKVDEPEQSSVVNALKQIRKKSKMEHVLVIHSSLNTVSHTDVHRITEFNQEQFEKAWGEKLPSLSIDFDCDAERYHQRDELIVKLSEMLPIVGSMVSSNEHLSNEERNFEHLRKDVLWYASVASVSDLIPIVGLASVPSTQAQMLRSLAEQYRVEWNVRTFSELIGCLGSSFGILYGIKFGIRQAAKFIPGYGQTIGAGVSSAFSFGSTYGLGRAACYYFYRKSKNEIIDTDAMQELYKKAFELGKKVANHAES